MKLFFRQFFILLALAGAIVDVRADTLVFDNGDRLTGTVLEQTADSIRFNSATLGTISVPAAHTRIEATPPPATTPGIASTTDTSHDSKAAALPEKTETTWADGFKKTVNMLIPGEVTGRLDQGLTSTRTNASTTQIMMTGNLSVNNAPDLYDLKGYYYYTATRAADGSLSRSADRYGSHASYRHDLNERLFLNNEDSYMRDFLANINHQAQNTFSGGYTLWKSQQMNLALQAGPSQRYLDADGIATKWRTLGTGKQTFKWRISDKLRLEQDSSAQSQLDDFGNHAWLVNAALISKLDQNLELSMRFSQSYNTLVGINGARSEQVLAVALGVTF